MPYIIKFITGGRLIRSETRTRFGEAKKLASAALASRTAGRVEVWNDNRKIVYEADLEDDPFLTKEGP